MVDRFQSVSQPSTRIATWPEWLFLVAAWWFLFLYLPWELARVGTDVMVGGLVGAIIIAGIVMMFVTRSAIRNKPWVLLVAFILFLIGPLLGHYIDWDLGVGYGILLSVLGLMLRRWIRFPATQMV